MEQIRIESVEVKQMERQSADGARDVEGEADVVHFAAAAAAAAAAVFDIVVESILQVKKVEVDFVPLKQVAVEFVSAIPMNPDPTHTEEEAAAAALQRLS